MEITKMIDNILAHKTYEKLEEKREKDFNLYKK